MIRPSIRVASALVALFVLLVTRNPFALLIAIPLFATWRAPAADELPSIEGDYRRYRLAMFVCFVAAYLSFLFAVTTRGLRSDSIQRVAALGGALWIVAFLLLFPTAYYASRRAVLLASRDEE